MNVSEPAAAQWGAVSIGILRALSQRSTPMSARQIVRQAASGTPAGVRRALDRLVVQGTVTADPTFDPISYALNYEHVLYPAIESLLDARGELRRRLVAELRDWDPQPELAALYGSAARQDGDEDSDIDVLLVRPTRRGTASWVRQVHQLRTSIHSWTGNHAHVLDLNRLELRRLISSDANLVAEWRRDIDFLTELHPDILRVAGL